jgi:recombination protein RecR
MSLDHDPIGRLAALLSRLPGIGERSAMRLTLDLAKRDADYLAGLSAAIAGIGRSLKSCTVCGDLSALEVCRVCDDVRRDDSMICVVASPQDRIAIERTAAFRGRYHVLGGVLDPIAGIGPKQLRVEFLLDRIRDRATSDSPIVEVIVATPPTIGGDATALYLARVLEPLGVEVSRIASGVVTGGELEHADPTTLQRAIADRRTI